MMTTYKHIKALAATMTLSVLLSSTAYAAQDGHRKFNRVKAPTVTYTLKNHSPQKLRYVQSSISASQAKAIARKHVPGAEVVDIKRKGPRYRVRMIRRDGRVIDVFIDAATGRVL